MEKKETPEFKISIDKEHSGHYFQEAKKDLRFEKLNQKVTIISILIPCIIVLLIVYSYFDMKEKISGVHDSGVDEIQKLTKDFDKKISGLSSQYSKLEESFDKRMAAADKTNYSMKSNLENLTKKTEETKADKTELAGAISALNSHISNLKNDLPEVSSKIKETNINLSQKISDLSKALVKTESEFNKLQANISTMLSGKADKKELDLLRNQQRQYQNELSQLSRDVEGKIETIRKQLSELERKMGPREVASKVIKTDSSPPPQQIKPDNITKPESASKAVAPKPGAIVEQDIK